MTLANEISSEFDAINSLQIAGEQDLLALEARNHLNSQALEDDGRAQMAAIIENRTRYVAVLTHMSAHGLSADSTASQLRTAVSSLDATTTMLTGLQLLRLHQDTIESQKISENHAATEAVRDRHISRIAGAFLLPTLWFSFLGANIFPEKVHGWTIASELNVYIAMAVGAASGIAGWFLVPILPKRRKQK
jgi:hypothetical protein